MTLRAAGGGGVCWSRGGLSVGSNSEGTTYGSRVTNLTLWMELNDPLAYDPGL